MGSSSVLRFDGRVAVVTGGGRGLGRAHCLLLAARGAKVLVNNRTPAKADEVVAQIKAAGGVAAADYHDVASAGAAVVEHALELWGRVDVVIANAGQLEDGTFAKMPVEKFTALLDTHVVGHFNVVQAAWPHFREQGYGRIVVISSESGLHGNFGQTNYAAAKGALMGMGQTCDSIQRPATVPCAVGMHTISLCILSQWDDVHTIADGRWRASSMGSCATSSALRATRA
jgi:NAD(P)-dependent dehydrogenase (short-subunit alcohol dehydrogenase family)